MSSTLNTAGNKDETLSALKALSQMSLNQTDITQNQVDIVNNLADVEKPVFVLGFDQGHSFVLNQPLVIFGQSSNKIIATREPALVKPFVTMLIPRVRLIGFFLVRPNFPFTYMIFDPKVSFKKPRHTNVDPSDVDMGKDILVGFAQQNSEEKATIDIPNQFESLFENASPF